MPETTFTFQVDDDLKEAFAETARSQDRSSAQLLRVLMREAVQRQQDEQDHDAWFRGEVEQALKEADDPAVRRISNDDVKSNWERRRSELAERKDSKA